MRRRELLTSAGGGGNYEYVDLGLPSGKLWATCNIGAHQESEYGLYFQWGDISGYTASQLGSGEGKKSFEWASYKYNSDGSSPTASNMTKYNSTDKKTVLESSDDAAIANMEGEWRMPTIAEYQELTANTTSAWTTVNGVYGLKLTSKKYTSKYIFFPAAGDCYSATVYGAGSYGRYWSSSLSTSNILYGRDLGFGSSGVYTDGSYGRFGGRSVRGIMDKPLPDNAKKDGSTAAPLSVLFADKSSGTLFIIENSQDWPSASDYEPVGIVVVPGKHNRYGDGTCGVMSLVGMDYSHPTSGIPITSNSQTDDVVMVWGHYGSTVGNNIFKSITALTSSQNYIPHQSSSASTATISSGSIIWPYGGTTTAPTSAASTEYSNTNGYVTATSGKSGCDFNGIRNTAAMYVKTRSSKQWTASTVENGTNTANTAPAACCARYKTKGTKSFLEVYTGITSNNTNYGTTANTKSNTMYWYLPADGELCYLPSKKYEINKTVAALNAKYGNVAVQLDRSSRYWSSSECDINRAWYVRLVDGNVNYGDKNSNFRVRAFLRF